MRIAIPFLLCFSLFGLMPPSSVPAQPPLKKKMIEFGWDRPYSLFIAKHIAEMQNSPFDGVAFCLKGHTCSFDTTRWEKQNLHPLVEPLEGLDWGRLTDSFIYLYATDVGGMDWFDDGQWETIVANNQLISKAVKESGCAGTIFDVEPYGDSPWVLEEGRTYDELAAQVRKRGAQYMEALQTHKPDMKVLFTFMFSLMTPHGSERDPVAWQGRFLERTDHYHLAPAFYTGMIEAAGPDVRLIDGNERSYYYESTLAFYSAYRALKQGVRALLPVELRPKYGAQVEVGVAVYVDRCYGLYSTNAEKLITTYMSDLDRERYLLHQVRYALETADEYVWVYTEKGNWWADFMPKPTDKEKEGDLFLLEPPSGPESFTIGKTNLPKNLESRLRQAREEYESRKGMNFRLEPTMKAAREKRAEALKKGEKAE
ncbi:hypothetical protein HQ520_04445 [bacterium]|nr:hypothetical protein [bacterium]